MHRARFHRPRGFVARPGPELDTVIERERNISSMADAYRERLGTKQHGRHSREGPRVAEIGGTKSNPSPCWSWRRVATTLKTRLSLRELDHQGTFFFFLLAMSCFGGSRDGCRVKTYCAEWRTLTPRKWDDMTQCASGMISRSVHNGNARPRKLRSIPVAVSGSGHTRKRK